MRILSGTLHNREITIPATCEIRPTASKLRGQVFNICQGGFAGGRALDLFAGSGAVGIEALSRGASHCTFVECDRQAVLCLQENIDRLHLECVTKIIPVDAIRALKSLSAISTPFSFVYIDPPYAIVEPLHTILNIIDLQLPLADGAFIFLETKKKAFTPQPLQTLSLISHRSSGDSDLWHFEKSVPEKRFRS
jgi:16S rRNA (guanine966-N2)-methyltransferase